MSRYLRVFAAALLMVMTSAVPISGQEVALSYDEAVSYALRNSLELRAAEALIRQAEGRLIQSGRLDNPSLEVGASTAQILSESEEIAATLAFSQRFPVTQRLQWERAVAALDVAKAKAEVAEVRRVIAGEAGEAYVLTRSALERRGALEETLESTAGSSKLMEERFEAGQASAAEQSLAKLELARVRMQLAELDRELREREREFAVALELPVEQRLVPTQSLTSVISQLETRTGSDGRVPGAMLALQQEAAMADARGQLLEAERWEDWNVQLRYSLERTEDVPEGYGRDHFIGLAVTIPLPLWDKNEGAQLEQAAKREEAEAKMEAFEHHRELEESKLRTSIVLIQGEIKDLREGFDREVEATSAILEEAYQQQGAELNALLLVRREQTAGRVLKVDLTQRLGLALVELETLLANNPNLHLNVSQPSKSFE